MDPFKEPFDMLSEIYDLHAVYIRRTFSLSAMRL